MFSGEKANCAQMRVCAGSYLTYSSQKDWIASNHILTFRQINALQKQPSIGVLSRRCCENMLQICSRTPMLKCDFNKVGITLRHWCSPVYLLYICRTPFPKINSRAASDCTILRFLKFNSEIVTLRIFVKHFSSFNIVINGGL